MMLSRCAQLSAVAMFSAGCLLGQAARAPQTFPLRNASALAASNLKAEAATYLGRHCVRITMDGEDRGGLALLTGTDFQDGVIEADIALKPLAPAGVRFPGFVGIAFRVPADGSQSELFYLRTGNSAALDQAQRNHTVQYVSDPGFGWYRLRREWPAIYESHADIAFETWTKVRIEVAGRGAKLYLNGSTKPSLIVDGLKSDALHGAVGLWGYTDEEAYFSNVRITPAAPQAVTNGSDVAGAWEMRYLSDAGPMAAAMELHRDGGTVSGTWSGPLGQKLAVTGTWRNGYVELSFPGEWPKGSRQGAPGPVTAFLAGWIDGDSGKGRMRVEGHSDGVWMAKRKS